MKNLGLAILASLLIHGPAGFGVQAEKSASVSTPSLLVACSPDGL